MECEQTISCLPSKAERQFRQKSVKEQNNKQVTLRMHIGLYEELKKISEQTGTTITSLLIAAIWMNVLKP